MKPEKKSVYLSTVDLWIDMLANCAVSNTYNNGN